MLKKDLELIRDWRNKEDIFKFNSQFYLLNLINQQNWFKLINSKNSDRKMLMVDFEDHPIGICGLIHLDKENHNADIALIIGELEFHGRGLGTIILTKLIEYGFHKLKLNRIGADIFEYNYTSFKVFKKLNFQKESIDRESLWRYGKWWDIHKFSLLREDYLQKFA